jgi:hypothetical protein
MNFKSDGLAHNAPLALIWIELALAGGQPGAFEIRDAMLQSMTAAGREEGSGLLARWRADHPGKDPAELTAPSC